MRQNFTLTHEDRIFIERYVTAVARKLEENYNLDSRETSKLVQESVFLELILEDPEFVVNHHPVHWAEEIYTSRKRVFQPH